MSALKTASKDTYGLMVDQIINPADQELNVKKNFACTVCGNLPFAPVMQCDECEHLYCNNERCLQGINECQNKKCKKSRKF